MPLFRIPAACLRPSESLSHPFILTSIAVCVLLSGHDIKLNHMHRYIIVLSVAVYDHGYQRNIVRPFVVVFACLVPKFFQHFVSSLPKLCFQIMEFMTHSWKFTLLQNYGRVAYSALYKSLPTLTHDGHDCRA